MKERPILFSGEMVRAILDGKKTQTRRVVKPQPDSVRSSALVKSGYETKHGYEIKCPYGQPGDRLWVRETWRVGAWQVPDYHIAVDYKEGTIRKEWLSVDDEEQFERLWKQSCKDAEKSGIKLDSGYGDYKWEKGQGPTRWRPSIHMPRWASRINLEITKIRVERLRDISEEDAEAEGLYYNTLYEQWGGVEVHPAGGYRWYDSPVNTYKHLWQSINGTGSWDKNPWVWVVEFRRVL